MFSTTFDRPVGAAADAKELEYITALHQTTDEVEDDFINGSIEAKDVKYYLISRYGIKVSTENIQNLIFRDLAGGSGEGECIDICEIVAILLIPFFAKAAKGGTHAFRNVNDDDDDDPNSFKSKSISRKKLRRFDSIKRAFRNESQIKSYMEDINRCQSMLSKEKTMEHVLNIILADSTGTVEPRPITKELMLTIFARYEELDLLHDEGLIEEMIFDISGGDPNALLDAESFTRALSKDILLYDIENELRVSTFYEDVFGMEGEENDDDDQNNDQSQNNKNNLHDSNETHPLRNGSRDIELAGGTDTQAEGNLIENIFTCSQVDLMADGMRSKLHLGFAYLSFVFFIYSCRDSKVIQICDENSSSFWCDVGSQIYFFLLVMIVIIALGTPWILILTAGNSLRGRSVKNVIFGLVGIVVFVVLPMFGVIPQNSFFDVRKLLIDEKDRFNEIIQCLIAFVLCTIQIISLAHTLKPSLKNSKNRIISYLFTGGTIRATFLLKLALSLKTHNMVKNALDLHFDGRKYSIKSTEPTRSSTNAVALLNYSKTTERTERVGGLFWCWNGYISRSILHKEGVMVNTRLVVANILQFFLVILLCYLMPNLLIETMHPLAFKDLKHEVMACDQSTFDPDKCSFPGTVIMAAGVAVCYGIKIEDQSCISDQYFEPLSGLLDVRRELLCDEMSSLLDNGSDSAWPLIAELKDGLEFTESAMTVTNTTLCQGLYSFNETIWGELQAVTGIDAISIPCTVPKEFFCNVEAAQTPTDEDLQNVMSSFLHAYEAQYNDTMQHVLICLENYNNTVINSVFESATNVLQETLQKSAQSYWNALFVTEDKALSDTFNLNQLLKNWTDTSDGPELTVKFDAVFNYTGIVRPISAPSVTSNYDILQLERKGMDLISSVFIELDKTSTRVILAYESELANLPPYFSLPDLPVTSLCDSIWAVKSNATLLVETIGSTSDDYCRAQVTACTINGICLLGLDKEEIDGKDEYSPFQFIGKKCYERPETRRLVEIKTERDSWTPELWQINLALVMAMAVSILCLLGVAALFIPNAILTSLKYRSGVLPSLRNKDFTQHRNNLFQLTYLVPVVFWSAFIMAILVFIFTCLVVFFLVLDVLKPALSTFLALVVGLAVTMAIKIVILTILGKYNYAAFYRRRPVVVNVASVAFECYHFFLAIASVSTRFVKLLAMSLLFIGRVDRPILADDLPLDLHPHIFRQAILASDAHRHPYIERLGMMYMMKLKHGDQFGKKSSSTWRLLFVFALMPWLRKYRILDKFAEIDEKKVREAFALVKDKSDQMEELNDENSALKDENSALKEQLKLARQNNDDSGSESYMSAGDDIEFVDRDGRSSPIALEKKSVWLRRTGKSEKVRWKSERHLHKEE